MFPPMLLYLHFRSPEKSGFGIWLPLFLVWLILLPLVVFVLIITVLVDFVLVLANERYHYYTLLLLRVLGVLSETRGLTVSVHSTDTDIDIRFA